MGWKSPISELPIPASPDSTPCLAVCMFIWLSVCLSGCLLVCLSVCLSVCLGLLVGLAWSACRSAGPSAGPSWPQNAWMVSANMIRVLTSEPQLLLFYSWENTRNLCFSHFLLWRQFEQTGLICYFLITSSVIHCTLIQILCLDTDT